MKPAAYVLALSLVGLSPCAAVAQNDDRPNRRDMLNELFAPELFGTTMKWFGVTDAFVFFDSTCVFPPGEELGPNERCVVLNPAPAVTSWDYREVGKITFPGNTFKNVICPVFLHIINYQLRNTTGASQDAFLNHRTSITIESEALKDPSAIDPVTGLPMNGKYFVPWGARVLAHTLDAGERHREVLQVSRACNAGVSKPQLATNGIPPRVADKLFREPMTIHLGFFGNAKLAEFGTFSFSMRVTGN